MKVKVLTILFLAGLAITAKVFSAGESEQAKNFPSGALVYLQTNDAQQLITAWENSKFKQNADENESLSYLKNTHLGIKLAERLDDFSAGFGFDFNLQTLASLSDNQVAIALYDVGKLEFVFVAPMNEEVFAATTFMQNSGNFDEATLENGLKYYLTDLEVDRNRQRQSVVFANVNGRFILATSQKVFLQTVAIIDGKSSVKRLYDETSFKKLRERSGSNLLTVWVNQEKLNADYYFKRYWLTRDASDFQNIQAGIFSLNLTENGLIENRKYLLKSAKTLPPIAAVEAKEMLAKIPDDAPFYRLQKAEKSELGEMIYQTILDRRIEDKKNSRHSDNWNDSTYDYDYDSDYEYLGEEFDTEISEIDVDETPETQPFSAQNLGDSLASAQPSLILNATNPQLSEAPFFMEFQKISIVKLNNPNAFRSRDFENAVEEAVKNRLTKADANFAWRDEKTWRRLFTPIIGWEIGYQVQGDKLFIANNFEFLEKSLANRGKADFNVKNIDELTVIRFDRREELFDEAMKRLVTEDSDKFVETVGGGLDFLQGVRQVEARRKTEGEFLREEISARFAPPQN